jgi:hypothetical protein
VTLQSIEILSCLIVAQVEAGTGSPSRLAQRPLDLLIQEMSSGYSITAEVTQPTRRTLQPTSCVLRRAN